MGMSNQDVSNNAPISHQVNVADNNGTINFSSRSRLAQRFLKLKEEVEKDIRYQGFLDDFRRFNTELDGKSMPEKLEDGGFNKREIDRATFRKHQYSKKLERFKLYETAQRIDLELFAMINLNFETYIEPLIEAGADTASIKQCLQERIINPIHSLLNEDGQEDTILNYTVEDIYGMVFFLTGKCHLNWTKYDSI